VRWIPGAARKVDHVRPRAKPTLASTRSEPMLMTSRVIHFCRTIYPSGHVEAFTADLPGGHIRLDERVFHRVHHLGGPTDQVFVPAELKR